VELAGARLTVGSLHTWELDLTRDGAAWDVSGLAVQLQWKSPSGTVTSKTASTATAQGVVTYVDAASVLTEPGIWTVCANVPGYGPTDPVQFTVVESP
jgi:hypothetical protein